MAAQGCAAPRGAACPGCPAARAGPGVRPRSTRRSSRSSPGTTARESPRRRAVASIGPAPFEGAGPTCERCTTAALGTLTFENLKAGDGGAARRRGPAPIPTGVRSCPSHRWRRRAVSARGCAARSTLARQATSTRSPQGCGRSPRARASRRQVRGARSGSVARVARPAVRGPVGASGAPGRETRPVAPAAKSVFS